MEEYNYTNNQTLEQIQKKFKQDDWNIYTPKYDKPINPIHKGNTVWNHDMLRSGVEMFFLLKNNLMRQIMESYGEYVGDIDYGKNVKITYKSEIKDDKEDWNANFTQALINNFGSVALNGEFPLPAPIIAYLKDRNAIGVVKNANIPSNNISITQWQQAIYRVESLVKAGICEYAALAITGCSFTEDSWSPKGLVNRSEASGKGSGFAAGNAAGEGPIGITGIEMKKKIIDRLGFWNEPDMGNKSNFKATYNFGISKLPMDKLIACVIEYYKLNGAWSRLLLNTKSCNDERTQTAICCAAYRSKAGDSNFPGNNASAADFIRCTHNGGAGASWYESHHKYNGFACGIITAYILAKVIKTKNQGELNNVKNIALQAKHDIEQVIGSFH